MDVLGCDLDVGTAMHELHLDALLVNNREAQVKRLKVDVLLRIHRQVLEGLVDLFVINTQVLHAKRLPNESLDKGRVEFDTHWHFLEKGLG